MSSDNLCYTPGTPADPQNSLDGYSTLSSNSLSSLLTSQGFSASSYDSKIQASRAGWDALAVITLLLYLIAVANIIWIRVWPHKTKGLFKLCGKPRTQRFKNVFLVGSLVLCVAVFAAGIAGAALNSNTKENGERAVCEFTQFSNEIIQGSPSDPWGGITQSQTSYMRLRDRFSSEVSAIDVTFSTNTTDTETRLEEYKANLDLLYNTRENYYVKSANYSDSPLDLIVPDFIQNLGPQNTSGTYLASLAAEGDTLLTTVENSSNQLESDITQLQQDKTTIQASAITAADNYNTFSQILSTFVQEMSNYMTNNYNNWTYLYNRAYAASIVFIVLSILLFATLIYRFKRPFQLSVQLAYVVWHLLMIWTVVSFFFAADLQGMHKRSSEYCDVFNRIAGDPDYLASWVPQYPAAFASTLNSCFYGQGETFRPVGFETGTLLLSDISQNIQNVNPYLADGPESQEISNQRDLINMYIQGLLLIDGGAINSASPQANLNLLNSWSDYAIAGSNQVTLAECAVSKDIWLLNTTNCTTSTPFNSAYDADDFFGDSMCLGIFSVDSGTIGQRYNNQNFAACNPVGGMYIADILIQQYQGLNLHFDDVRRKFRRLDQYYDNTLGGSYEEILRAASTMTGPISSLNSSFGDYLDFISGSQNGILNNANCAFFKESLLNANYFLCETASGLESRLAALVAASVLSLLGCIFTYLYFRKLEAFKSITYNEKDFAMNRITPEPIPQDMPRSLDWDSQGKSSDDVGTKEDLEEKVSLEEKGSSEEKV